MVLLGNREHFGAGTAGAQNHRRLQLLLMRCCADGELLRLRRLFQLQHGTGRMVMMMYDHLLGGLRCVHLVLMWAQQLQLMWLRRLALRHRRRHEDDLSGRGHDELLLSIWKLLLLLLQLHLRHGNRMNDCSWLRRPNAGCWIALHMHGCMLRRLQMLDELLAVDVQRWMKSGRTLLKWHLRWLDASF